MDWSTGATIMISDTTVRDMEMSVQRSTPSTTAMMIGIIPLTIIGILWQPAIAPS